jgi:transcriptional regulator with XRE-family HTH domain
MIRNKRQLATARRKLDELCSAADSSSGLDRKIYLEAAEEVESEIDEFEAITSGLRKSFGISSIDDLIDALVKARLARGMTQRELADALGVAEQMVQRDEAGGYETASFTRIGDVADALDYDLYGVFGPRETTEAELSVEFVGGQATPDVTTMGSASAAWYSVGNFLGNCAFTGVRYDDSLASVYSHAFGSNPLFVESSDTYAVDNS